MKPTRKVQAQRKFAHGAAPASVSTSAASQDKRFREPPRAVQPRVVRLQVAAAALLDVVSLKSVHQHVQPIVLVERLKNPAIHKTKVIDKKNKVHKVTQDRNAVKVQKKRKRVSKNHTKSLRRPYSWDMTLRSRNTKTVKTVPLTKQVRKRTGTQDPHPQGNNVKRSRGNCKENFTSDDNKPLTHFAKIADKKSILKKKTGAPKAKKNGTTREKAKDAPIPKSAAQGLRKGRTKVTNAIEPIKTSLQSGNQIPQDVTISPQVQVTNDPDNLSECNTVLVEALEPIAEHDRGSNRSTCRTVLVETLAQIHEHEPQPGPSGLQARPLLTPDVSSELPNSSECDQLRGFSLTENEFAAPYYNDHGIQRWISVSQSSPSPSLKIEDLSANEHLADPIPLTLMTICPASAWVTLREVVNAPKQERDARCANCETCTRIAKVFQLSTLLRKQRQIVNTEDEERYLEPAAPLPGDENTMVSPYGDLFMELLPNNPHFMIKIKIQNTLGKQIISARLVPRTNSERNEEFNLVEHEYIVDKLITIVNMAESAKAAANLLANGDRDGCPELDLPIQEESEVDISSNCSVTSEGPSDTESNAFPKSVDRAKLVDAPVFYPTKEEFADPIAYFEKIAPVASKFGLCKVIPPPSHRFTPKCKINDDIRFDVTNQYISRLYNRWGPAARELCAIKACLTSQCLNLTRSPLLDGIEVNLPKLYHVVQRNGGLEKVIDKKRWGRVAEEMSFTKTPNPEKKLDNIYVKYLLPYDTLAHKERQEIIRKVEKHWNKRNQKMLDRAMNPLHRQKRLLGESDSSGEDTGDESEVGNALAEAEDCIVPGSCMNLNKFKRIAAIALENNFRTSTAQTAQAVEEVYWRFVLLGTEHVCVNTASIDTGEEGYGFSKNKQDPYSQHPWNLKMLSQNSSNVLRSLGPVLGLTVPSLHLCMVFSTSCWHSDPHGLPWTEYMHQGSTKIWYGIPDEQSQNFRKAVETLCPTSCQNKAIWLPSDISMIPPTLLLEHNVSLSKVSQNPGEFIMVYPRAYSCSISTGYTLSESVYFATNSWLNNVHLVFQELRESCEPTMFSLEQLLLAVATDTRTPLGVLQQVLPRLSTIVDDELGCRDRLRRLGLPFINDENREHIDKKKRRNTSAWNVRDLDECDVCRMTLYLSKVSGLTGRRSSVCLQHALKLLEKPISRDDNAAGLQVVIYVSVKDLQQVIQQSSSSDEVTISSDDSK